eukprot:COSAG05_NODE_965_length_6403_cov_50.682741_4_plen_88_part_00
MPNELIFTRARRTYIAYVCGWPLCGLCVSVRYSISVGRAEDPNETNDLAAKLPAVLESLKQRYLELKASQLDQRTVLSTIVARQKLY